MYSVVVDVEGYELFEDNFIVDGDTDKYTITLDPVAVNVTLEVTYNNATGSKLAVSNANVRFTNSLLITMKRSLLMRMEPSLFLT